MDKKPNLGDQFIGALQEALDHQDFTALADIATKTTEVVREGIRTAGDQIQEAAAQVSSQTAEYRANREAADTQAEQRRAAEISRAEQRRAAELERRRIEARYKSPGVLRASGIALAVVGGYFSFFMLISTLVAFTMGFAAMPAVVTLAVLLVLSAWVFAKGLKNMRIAKAFEQFRRTLGAREWCSIEELSAQTGLEYAKVVEYLQIMTAKGLFTEGRLDPKGRWFAVTDGAYARCLQGQEGPVDSIPVEAVVERVDEKDDRDAGLPPEVRALIAEGEESLQAMKRANDKISDEAVSAKVAALQAIVERIIEYGRQHPECADDLERLVHYYMPTTNRLLDTYDDLEEQPIQGGNISASRKEIEDTLDLLSEAYGNLLDGMYKDVAWDVSADASVLKDVLTQEGLIDDPHRIHLED